MAPYPQNPFPSLPFTPSETLAYLTRLSLPDSLTSQPPSLPLLQQLFTAQNQSVPKDTSPLHVPEADWTSAPHETPIVLGSALGEMPVGALAWERIVEGGKGGFCFATNGTFARFLRAWGFRVSEMATRCYLGRNTGEDPTVHPDGWHWGTLTHVILVVDWPESDGRYLVDAGWGPWGQPLPIKLEDRVPSRGVNSYQAFELRHEELPLSSWMPKPIDTIKGWTLYSFITTEKIVFPITSSTPGYWSPHLHFLPISVPSLDIELYSHFSATHEHAHFTAFWMVARELKGTGGARRSMMYREREGPEGEKKMAKVYTTGGDEGEGRREGRDIEWVEMKVGPVKAYLEEKFGFRF